MKKRNKYGEDTVLVSVRVPKSKKDEVLDKIYLLLNEYLVLYSSQIEVVDATIESVAVEKKSNPADMDSLRAIGSGIKPFKCGCWIDEKKQLRRPKGSNCNLFKSEHKR
jgi:hypothetical protein